MALWGRTAVSPADTLTANGDLKEALYEAVHPCSERIAWGARLSVPEGARAVLCVGGAPFLTFAPGDHLLGEHTARAACKAAGKPFRMGKPFPGGVVFVRTEPSGPHHWNMRVPVVVRDPNHGAIRVRLAGALTFRVGHASRFLSELAGIDPPQPFEDMLGHLRTHLLNRLTDWLATYEGPALAIHPADEALRGAILGQWQRAGAPYGILVEDVRLDEVHLPAAVESEQTAAERQGMRPSFEPPAGTAASDGGPGGTLAPDDDIAPDARTGLAVTARMVDAFQAAGDASAAVHIPEEVVVEQPKPAPEFQWDAGKRELESALQDDPASSVANAGPSAGAAYEGRPAAETSFEAAAWEVDEQPPPLPPSTKYYIGLEGSPHGPLTLEELAARIRERLVTRDTRVRKKGMPQWAPAYTFGELASILDDVPPPLPPRNGGSHA